MAHVKDDDMGVALPGVLLIHRQLLPFSDWIIPPIQIITRETIGKYLSWI